MWKQDLVTIRKPVFPFDFTFQITVQFFTIGNTVFALQEDKHALDAQVADDDHDDDTLEESGFPECVRQSQDTGANEGDEDVGNKPNFVPVQLLHVRALFLWRIN